MEPHKKPPMEDGVSDLFITGSLNDHPLYEITVDSLQRLMSESHLTAVEYVQFCLERIRKASSMLLKFLAAVIM